MQGKTGMERSYEKVLMGQRGIEYWKRDNKNRLTERFEMENLIRRR
jgi:penicillin-binding protein 2